MFTQPAWLVDTERLRATVTARGLRARPTGFRIDRLEVGAGGLPNNRELPQVHSGLADRYLGRRHCPFRDGLWNPEERRPFVLLAMGSLWRAKYALWYPPLMRHLV